MAFYHTTVPNTRQNRWLNMMERRRSAALRSGQRGGALIDAQTAKRTAISQAKKLARLTLPGVQQFANHGLQDHTKFGLGLMNKKIRGMSGLKGFAARKAGGHVNRMVRREAQDLANMMNAQFDRVKNMLGGRRRKRWSLNLPRNSLISNVLTAPQRVRKKTFDLFRGIGNMVGGGRKRGGRRSLYMPPTTKSKMLAGFRQIQARERAYNLKRGIGGFKGPSVQRGGIGPLAIAAGSMLAPIVLKPILKQIGLGRGQRGGMVGHTRIKMIRPTRMHYQLGRGAGYYFPRRRRRTQRGGAWGALAAPLAKATGKMLIGTLGPIVAKAAGGAIWKGIKKQRGGAMKNKRPAGSSPAPTTTVAVPAGSTPVAFVPPTPLPTRAINGLGNLASRIINSNIVGQFGDALALRLGTKILDSI